MQSKNGVGNLWSVPVETGQPQAITTFTEQAIDDFDWSIDGQEILVLRSESTQRVVLISNFR